jgi:hypothetical protein
MMSEAIEITLAEGVLAQIDALASARGVSREEWIVEVVEARLWIAKFRAVRARLLQVLEARGERYTDDDIFAMVS